MASVLLERGAVLLRLFKTKINKKVNRRLVSIFFVKYCVTEQRSCYCEQDEKKYINVLKHIMK